MSWQVLYTKPRNEKKVAENLFLQGFEVYCPCQKELKQWSDRKKWIEEPIFKSYVFVQSPETELKKVQILETPGVVRFLYWLGKPAKVKQIEIETIKCFLGEYKFSKFRSFHRGTVLSVKEGALKGVEGVVVYQTKNEVVLKMHQLGMSLSARVPKFNVEQQKKL